MSASFHAKLGLVDIYILLRGKQPTIDDTLQELTWPLVNQAVLYSWFILGGIAYWYFFWQPDALLGINQLQIREETQEFGNLFGGSWISTYISTVTMLVDKIAFFLGK